MRFLSAHIHARNTDSIRDNASVEENQHRLNANMKCSIDGNIGRIPYVGTGESEVLPLNQVLAGVKGLVPMLHKKNLGGPVCQ